MRKILLLIVCVFTGMSLFAQDKTFNGSLLWKVSGKDLKHPSYVFGTYHLITGDYVDNIPGLKEAMSSTKQVVGELYLLNQAESQAIVMQESMLSPDESYKSNLSEEDYNLLDNKLIDLMGAGLDQLGTLKPGALGPVITMVLYTSLDPTFNPDGFEGIDGYFQRIADEEGKKIVALETLEDQMKVLFYSKPQKWQMESLVCSIKNIDSTMESLAKLTEDYKKGDIQEIHKAAFENQDDPCASFTVGTKEELLDDRNNKWLDKLPGIMKENSSLITVGALHLAGKDGLLYQLDKMGYKVEPVK